MRVRHIDVAFSDARGSIRDILEDEVIEHVTIIATTKGAVRGNHVHRETHQFIYVLAGALRYAVQDLRRFEHRPDGRARHRGSRRYDDGSHDARSAGRPRVRVRYVSSRQAADRRWRARVMLARTTEEIIPVCEPLIGEREAAYVLDCVRSGWISSEGPYVARFEEAWAQYCGARYGIAVTNGTAALHAAVASLGLAPGDEVIMPSFTIIGCAHAIIAAGATPVLVDADPVTWCMDVAAVAPRITERTRAVMAVHIYGHPVDMGALRSVATRYRLRIVEDAAEAHGAEVRGARTGSLGDVGCFSFYANKILTTGEGGMVLTDDPAVAERVRDYRNVGFRADRRFYHTEYGRNERMTALQAAIGLAQVEAIDVRVRRKREIAQRYTHSLSDLDGLQLPVEMPWAKNVYWMYGILIDESYGDAASFAHRLSRRGVATRPFFLGMHEQPVLRDRGLFAGERYPVTERIARQGLYLPSGLTLTDGQIERVAAAVREELAS
jgi:perosamine synthetase